MNLSCANKNECKCKHKLQTQSFMYLMQVTIIISVLSMGICTSQIKCTASCTVCTELSSGHLQEEELSCRSSADVCSLGF